MWQARCGRHRIVGIGTSDLTLSNEDFGIRVQRETSLTMGYASWPLLAFLAVSAIQLIRDGIHTDYVWLGSGALLALVTMFAFGLISVQRAYGKPKHAWMGLAAAGGFVPYLYGLYVMGYWGGHSIREIGTSSFVWPMAKAGFFIILGYVFLRKYYRVAEIGRFVHKAMSIAAESPRDRTA